MNEEFIVSTRKGESSANVDVDKPVIHFLTVNGSLHQYEYELKNNTYVSVKRENELYGKVEVYNDRELYFLKAFRGGRSGEIIPDPHGLLTRDTDLSTELVERGSRFCEYLRVRPELFVSYRDYLRTRVRAVFDGVVNAIKNGENYGSY